MAEQVAHNLLQTLCKHDTIDLAKQGVIVLNRKDLEEEHNVLLARVHQLRRILDYPTLMTGKQQRRAHE